MSCEYEIQKLAANHSVELGVQPRNINYRVTRNTHPFIFTCRNFYELTRKDCMIKNLKRAKRNLLKNGQLEEAAQYDFYPVTSTILAIRISTLGSVHLCVVQV